jgi:hypothetical protein
VTINPRHLGPGEEWQFDHLGLLLPASTTRKLALALLRLVDAVDANATTQEVSQ